MSYLKKELVCPGEVVPCAKSIWGKRKNRQDLLCISIGSTQSWGIALTIRAIRAMLDLSRQVRAMVWQCMLQCLTSCPSFKFPLLVTNTRRSWGRWADFVSNFLWLLQGQESVWGRWAAFAQAPWLLRLIWVSSCLGFCLGTCPQPCRFHLNTTASYWHCWPVPPPSSCISWGGDVYA